ncbi:unnamed protein product [Rhodiola kirilowii]
MWFGCHRIEPLRFRFDCRLLRLLENPSFAHRRSSPSIIGINGVQDVSRRSFRFPSPQQNGDTSSDPCQAKPGIPDIQSKGDSHV